MIEVKQLKGNVIKYLKICMMTLINESVTYFLIILTFSNFNWPKTSEAWSYFHSDSDNFLKSFYPMYVNFWFQRVTLQLINSSVTHQLMIFICKATTQKLKILGDPACTAIWFSFTIEQNIRLGVTMLPQKSTHSP